MQVPGAMTMRRFRPISHDTRLSVVDHLDELRTRLMVWLITVAVAFGICFWSGCPANPRVGMRRLGRDRSRRGAVGRLRLWM